METRPPARDQEGAPPASPQVGIPPSPSCAGGLPCEHAETVDRVVELLRRWIHTGKGEGVHGGQLREALYPSLTQQATFASERHITEGKHHP